MAVAQDCIYKCCLIVSTDCKSKRYPVDETSLLLRGRKKQTTNKHRYQYVF